MPRSGGAARGRGQGGLHGALKRPVCACFSRPLLFILWCSNCAERTAGQRDASHMVTRRGPPHRSKYFWSVFTSSFFLSFLHFFLFFLPLFHSFLLSFILFTLPVLSLVVCLFIFLIFFLSFFLSFLFFFLSFFLSYFSFFLSFFLCHCVFIWFFHLVSICVYVCYFSALFFKLFPCRVFSLHRLLLFAPISAASSLQPFLAPSPLGFPSRPPIRHVTKARGGRPQHVPR